MSTSALIWIRAQWDRVAGYGCIAAGAVSMTVAAVQISRSPSILSQLSYIGSAALLGLLLAVVGVGLLVTADLHDEWRKLDRIEAATRAAAPARPEFWRNVPSTALRPAPVLLAAVGILGLATGFLRTSRTIDLDRAFQGMAVSATGLVALALATAAIIAGLRREVGDRVVGALAGWSPSPARREGSHPAAPLDAGDTVVVVRDLRRYHRPSCPAVSGLATVSVARADVGAGTEPCGICDAAGRRAPAEARQ